MKEVSCFTEKLVKAARWTRIGYKPHVMSQIMYSVSLLKLRLNVSTEKRFPFTRHYKCDKLCIYIIVQSETLNTFGGFDAEVEEL